MLKKQRQLLQICLTFLILFNIIVPVCFANTQNTDPYYSVIYNRILQISPSIGSDWADWTAKSIIYFSAQSQINPLLAAALFEQESGFNMAARSPTGAVGIAQLQPETAEMIGVNPYDPAENIQGGVLYLATQLKNFSYAGNWQASYAIAAYNAGPNAIHKYNGIPPYQETINHVIRIGQIYHQLENSL